MGERHLRHNIKRYLPLKYRTDDEAVNPKQGSAHPLTHQRIRPNTPRSAADTTHEEPTVTSRPFNVIYAFVLTETFAAYILIRGILYPFIVSGMSTAQAIVGGVLQVLIAAGMTYFGLRFYRGRFGSRLPMILITLCALWVTASTLVMNVSAYGLNIGQSITIAGVIGAAAAFIFVLMPSSRRYIEAVTEESGEEAEKYSRRRR